MSDAESVSGSAPAVVRSSEAPWLTRDVYANAPGPAIRWKTLISAELTGSAGLTMGLVEFPPGRAQQRHRHPQPETYFVLDGAGTLEIDGQLYPVCAGTAVYVPPGAWHHLINTGDEPLHLVYNFAEDSFAEVDYTYDE